MELWAAGRTSCCKILVTLAFFLMLLISTSCRILHWIQWVYTQRLTGAMIARLVFQKMFFPCFTAVTCVPPFDTINPCFFWRKVKHFLHKNNNQTKTTKNNFLLVYYDLFCLGSHGKFSLDRTFSWFVRVWCRLSWFVIVLIQLLYFTLIKLSGTAFFVRKVTIFLHEIYMKWTQLIC